jgi:pimeloyl-ACP methyl ester carboxylesterase
MKAAVRPFILAHNCSQSLFLQEIPRMTRAMLSITVAFLLLSCTNSKNKSMSAKGDAKRVKRDSISGYAPVNGLKMYYEIHGEGSPLVLIHGGGSTIQSTFGKILPLLAQHYKVIAVELQAHGRTNDRNSPETFAQDANDVAALLQYLKTPRAHILGFSNGGQTALQIGIDHPSVVDKLVLISSFYKRAGAIQGFFDAMPNATLDNMPQPLKAAYVQVNNDPTGLQTMFEKDKERMVNFKDWPDEQLQSIKAQTLIVAGDHDVVTTDHAIKMSKTIPNAELMILPGTHGSFIGEICAEVKGSNVPGATVSIIEEFLDK